MDLRMGISERERFLATERNGILSVSEGSGDVVASPVWFLYEPGGDIGMHLNDPSLKLTALRSAGRGTLTVQDEGDITGTGRPPRYVSVSGPVVEDRAFEIDTDGAEVWQSVAKYLGEDIGKRYIDRGGEAYITGNAAGLPRVVRIRPERWFSRDYGKGAEKWDEIVGVPNASQSR